MSVTCALDPRRRRKKLLPKPVTVSVLALLAPTSCPHVLRWKYAPAVPTQRVADATPTHAASKMSKRARDEDASLPQQPRRKRLGSSDIEVCEVCLGTMTFGSMTADEASCHQILDCYVALGGNFIDTCLAAFEGCPSLTYRVEPTHQQQHQSCRCCHCCFCNRWTTGKYSAIVNKSIHRANPVPSSAATTL